MAFGSDKDDAGATLALRRINIVVTKIRKTRGTGRRSVRIQYPHRDDLRLRAESVASVIPKEPSPPQIHIFA